MGLFITATGFNKEIYNSGYIGFTNFRIAVAKAYNKEFGELYEKFVKSAVYFGGLSEKETKRINSLSNKSLDILLLHSDCDGKLTPKECRLIYNITKDLKVDYPQSNYNTLTGYNQLEIFNEALLHCIKHRVIMRFK